MIVVIFTPFSACVEIIVGGTAAVGLLDELSGLRFGDALLLGDAAHAVGKVAGEGMLSVSFIPVLRFPSSSYRVLYVDDEYNYALVSDKKGSCLWFLGRSPQSTKDAISILKYEADARGFNTENLRYTAQGS